MAKVLFVAGLPGCGKTYHFSELENQGFRKFDDFKANARQNSSQFDHSQWYDLLISELGQGRNCAVADISFCSADARDEAERAVHNAVVTAEIEWLFFDNDVERCRANIERRNRASRSEDLIKLSEFAEQYIVPKGYDPVAVWSPTKT